ncbi:MAG: hypothetical protein WC348_01125 [Patescibacteria group bacterium]|jgi:hypothetical protein
MEPSGEQNKDTEIARKPHAYLEFGSSGHETEYLFTIQKDKYSEARELPFEWESKLFKKLGPGWGVANRGARIEIIPPDSKRTPETDVKVKETIGSLLGNEYEFVEKSQ